MTRVRKWSSLSNQIWIERTSINPRAQRPEPRAGRRSVPMKCEYTRKRLDGWYHQVRTTQMLTRPAEKPPALMRAMEA